VGSRAYVGSAEIGLIRVPALLSLQARYKSGKAVLFKIPRLSSQTTVFTRLFGFRGIRHARFFEKLPVFSLYPRNGDKLLVVTAPA